MKQNSKIKWLKEGDQNTQWLKEGNQNTGYFFKNIKGKLNRNVIEGLFRDDGSFICKKGQNKEELISSFENLLMS